MDFHIPEKWFERILEIDGVEGVIMYSAQGDSLYSLGTYLDETGQRLFIESMLKISGAYYLAGIKNDLIELYWDHRYLITRQYEGLLISVISRSLKLLPLIRMISHITLYHTSTDKKLRRLLRHHKMNPAGYIKQATLEGKEQEILNRLES